MSPTSSAFAFAASRVAVATCFSYLWCQTQPTPAGVTPYSGPGSCSLPSPTGCLSRTCRSSVAWTCVVTGCLPSRSGGASGGFSSAAGFDLECRCSSLVPLPVLGTLGPLLAPWRWPPTFSFRKSYAAPQAGSSASGCTQKLCSESCPARSDRPRTCLEAGFSGH